MFHPDGLRPCVTNWEAVAASLVQRLHREAVGGVLDDSARKLLPEILDYPGISTNWRTLDPDAALLPVVPVSFQLGPQRFAFFSAVTVLGTPQDITLQELRIESFFPADTETETATRRLGADVPAIRDLQGHAR
jgi:hypothetical protein